MDDIDSVWKALNAKTGNRVMVHQTEDGYPCVHPHADEGEGYTGRTLAEALGVAWVKLASGKAGSN